MKAIGRRDRHIAKIVLVSNIEITKLDNNLGKNAYVLYFFIFYQKKSISKIMKNDSFFI